MTTLNSYAKSQNGAALLTVLLLIATLSFIVLSISERTVVAARRTINTSAQSELLWRSFGAEALAMAVLQSAASGEDSEISPDHPIFLTPIDIPMDDGVGKIQFSDKTNCFNLNGLVSESGNGQLVSNQESADEFIALIESIGLGASEAEKIAAVISDWIDSDSLQAIRGAEDGFYTKLPTPFRSGGTLLADASEIRAMNGITEEIYRKLRPFVCTYPKAGQVPINVNKTTRAHAPLLVGLLGGRVDVRQAEELILLRPPGGFSNVSEFWEMIEIPEFTPSPETLARTAITSAYLEAKAEMSLGDISSETTMIFEKASNEIKLVSRTFGPDL